MIVDELTSTPRSCIISTKIPLTSAVLAVPAYTKQDDLNAKAPALEQDSSNASSPF